MFQHFSSRRPETHEPHGRPSPMGTPQSTQGSGKRAHMFRATRLATIVALLAAVAAMAASESRTPYWAKVREALTRGLPQTALAPMDSIVAGAVRQHAWAEAVRAVTLKIALESAVQGNKPEEKITRMRAAIAGSPAEMRPAMEAILAHWYWQYFQANRWRFAQRTATAAAPDSDFTTWDLPRLFAEIDRHYEAALAGAPMLRREPIARWDSLFAAANAPDAYRPTLYDFVAFEALDFWGSAEQAGARPEDAFVLQAESPALDDRDAFLRWTIAASDTASPIVKALKLHQELQRFHANDRDPSARLDADLWRIELAHEHAVGPTNDARYAAALERFAARNAAHEISSRALHALATLRNQQGDPAEARRLAILGRDRFPGSIGGRRCHNLVLEIEAPSLAVQASGNVWNAPPPVLNARYRNLERLWFRLVPLDFAAEVTSGRSGGWYAVGGLDIEALLARAPARRWSASVPPTPDFRERSERLPVPKGVAPGYYVLLASAREDFSDGQNTIVAGTIWVSELALVLRDGRPGGLEGFVLRAGGGEPVANAEVRTWQRKPRWDGIEAGPLARTDANGLFRIASSERLVGLLVTSGTQRLGSREGFPNYRAPNARPEERTLLFTDRAIYRPGQVIRFKGLCVRLASERDDYTTIAARAVTVVLRDPNNREVAKSELRTNAHGSFTGSFTAPEGGLRGAVMLVVQSGPNGATSVRVEEYKRPKFHVAFDPPREPARLAGPVELSGRALAYTGAPVDGAKVEWRVLREVRYPDWWWWRFGWLGGAHAGGAQAIAHGSATTDAEGRFTVTFTALPDSTVPAEQEPQFRFTVTGDVTDGAGETRSATRGVTVGYTALAASLSAPAWLEAAKPVELSLRTTSPDGEGRAARGTLVVARLRAPADVSRAADGATDYVEREPGHFVKPPAPGGTRPKIAPAPADPANLATWPEEAEVATRDVRTDTLGAAKVSLRLTPGAYRATFTTQDRYGRPVKAVYPLRVLDPAATRLSLAVPDLFAARETSVEPGEEFLAVWGTGDETAHAYVEVECNGRMLQSFWTDPRRTQVAIRQRVDASMRGGFTVRVTRVADNRAWLTEQSVSVPWSNKQLALRWEHFTSKLEPGRKETWSAVVTGPDSLPAAAEVVATLYDASLDAFAPLSWPGIWGFRANMDRRNPRSDLRPLDLMHVRGWWTWPWQDGTLMYRSVPQGLLWGDWTYGFDEMQRYGGRAEEAAGMVQSREDGAVVQRAGKSMAAPAAAPAAALEMKLGDADASRQNAVGQARGVTAGGAPETPAPGLAAIVARSDLRETAFFLPQLLTSANGEVRFEFTMPEALTEWRFLAFAHDDALRSGSLGGKAVTSKDLMVQPNPPRFLREGDEIEFTVKVTNRTDAAQKGTVRLEFFDAGTDAAADARLGNRATEQKLDVPASSSRTYAWRIRVPDGAGVLRYKAVAATKKLSDGEEGFVPVLSRRVLVTESLPLPIRGPATKAFDFERLLRSGASPTLQNQSLTVQVVSNPAWYAVMALPYLMEYPYECSEQTFNRLYANALARHIAGSQPRIHEVFEQWRGTAALDSPLEKNEDLKSVLVSETPWLRQAQNESQARRNVGILFEDRRLDRETKRTLARLEAMQLPGGLWPWFPGGPPNEYITFYITTGFGRLRHLGVDLPMEMPIRSLNALDAEADRWYHDILKCCDPEANHLNPTVALWLYGRSFFLEDQPIAKQHQEALDYWLRQARHHWLKVSDRQTRGHLALALMRFGDPATAKAIMRSVKEYSVADEEMGRYWRDTEYSWWWYRAPIETQALMIEAFDEVMNDTTAVEDCRVWLLKQKQTQDWKTTKATADAVYALLLRGTNILASKSLLEVTVGDSLVRPANVEAGTGFYEKRWNAAQVKPAMGHVTLKKTDTGVAWASLHWQYFEDMDRVTAYAGTPLRLEKKLFVRRAGKSGLELHEVTGPVRVGDELLVRVVLRTDRDMEYVHLKDYRGSGTEPVNVLSSYRYQDGLRYYEETRDVASHFFIDYLPKGTYVFEYPLRVQLKGRYTSGVAEIQCMYAPEFNSHSGSVPLVVE